MIANSYRGFTLIETLVVVGIVGILISLSVAGLRGAQSSARDSQRKTDLQDIRSALEIYKTDCGVYPSEPLPWGGQLIGNDGANCPASNVYMTQVPQDPQNATKGYKYEYVTNGTFTTYALCAKAENSSTSPTTCAGAVGRNCSTGGASCNYRLNNP